MTERFYAVAANQPTEASIELQKRQADQIYVINLQTDHYEIQPPIHHSYIVLLDNKSTELKWEDF
jgi:hypothetical protein